MLPLRMFGNIFSFEVLDLKKASKFDLFKHFKPQIFIFDYFPKKI